MKKSLLLLITLIIMIIGLSVVQIIVSNSLSTKGIVIGKLEEEIKNYKKENFLINEQLLVSSSLVNIASKAAEQGFIDNKSEIVLARTLMLAVKQ